MCLSSHLQFGVLNFSKLDQACVTVLVSAAPCNKTLVSLHGHFLIEGKKIQKGKLLNLDKIIISK